MNEAEITIVNVAIGKNGDLQGIAMNGNLFAIWVNSAISKHVEALKAKYGFDTGDDIMSVDGHTQWYVDQSVLDSMSDTVPTSLEGFGLTADQ
jgi:hypothetical protein